MSSSLTQSNNLQPILEQEQEASSKQKAKKSKKKTESSSNPITLQESKEETVEQTSSNRLVENEAITTPSETQNNANTASTPQRPQRSPEDEAAIAMLTANYTTPPSTQTTTGVKRPHNSINNNAPVRSKKRKTQATIYVLYCTDAIGENTNGNRTIYGYVFENCYSHAGFFTGEKPFKQVPDSFGSNIGVGQFCKLFPGLACCLFPTNRDRRLDYNGKQLEDLPLFLQHPKRVLWICLPKARPHLDVLQDFNSQLEGMRQFLPQFKSFTEGDDSAYDYANGCYFETKFQEVDITINQRKTLSVLANPRF